MSVCAGGLAVLCGGAAEPVPATRVPWHEMECTKFIAASLRIQSVSQRRWFGTLWSQSATRAFQVHSRPPEVMVTDTKACRCRLGFRKCAFTGEQ